MRRPRPLPGGRALVGGFLIAAAILGVLGLEAAAQGGPKARFVVVVAAHVLPAGHVVAADDIGMSAVDLPSAIAARSHRDRDGVIGRVLVANVAPGELLQRSALAPRGPRPGELEVSFNVDPARSLGIRIEPGDIVDVFLTTGDGHLAATSIVVRNVRIIDRQGRPGGSGFTYTIGLPSESAVQTMLTAVAAGAVSLVRSTSASASVPVPATAATPPDRAPAR